MATKKAPTTKNKQTDKRATVSKKKTDKPAVKPALATAAANTGAPEAEMPVMPPASTQVESSDPQVLNTSAFERLRKMNLWMALVLAAEAATIVTFGGTKAAPVTTSYLAVDQLASDAAGHQVLSLATRHLFDMRLSLVAAKALLVLALTCLIMATIGRKHYEKRLKRGSHVARWLAFGLGGGLMVTALAQISGITDIVVLFFMFVLTMLGFSLQPLAEKYKSEGRRGPLPHALCAAAITAVAVPWVVMLSNLAGVLFWDGTIPGSTYAMYASTALFFGCWALGSHFRIRRQGAWGNVFYAERMYWFLTFAAASLLAWQMFAGAL